VFDIFLLFEINVLSYRIKEFLIVNGLAPEIKNLYAYFGCEANLINGFGGKIFQLNHRNSLIPRSLSFVLM